MTRVLLLMLMFAVSFVATGFILVPSAGRGDHPNTAPPLPTLQQSGGKASASPIRSTANSSTSTNTTSPDPPCPPSVSLTTCGNLTYHNGRVMHNAANYLIFWLPSGTNPVSNGPYTYDNSTIDPTATSPSDTNYENLITRYFNDVCSSAFYSTLDQYPGYGNPILPGGVQAPTGPCTFGASWVDTSAYPGRRGTLADPLTQDDMINEVENARRTNGWRIGEDQNEFFIFTPFDVYDCNSIIIIFNFYGGCQPDINNPPGVVGPNIPHCAYHSKYNVGFLGTGPPVIFAVIANSGTVLSGPTSQTPPGTSCGTQTGPNHDQFADLVISQASHEQSESVTDPYGDGWYFMDTAHENGDQCAYDFLGVEPADSSNVILRGNPYQIQAEWDNTNSGCDMDTAGPPVGVSISLYPSFGNFGCCVPTTRFAITYQEAGETSALSSQVTSHCLPTACFPNNEFVTVNVTPGTTVTLYPIVNGREQWCVTIDPDFGICPPTTLIAPTTGSLAQAYIYYDLLQETPSKQLVPVPNGSLLPSVSDCPLVYNTAPSSSTQPEATIQVHLTSAQIAIWPVRDSVASICDKVLNQPTARWETPVSTWNIGQLGGQIGPITYYGQYSQTVSYSVVGGGSPVPPYVFYRTLGNFQLTSLSTSAQTLWMDIGQTAYAVNPRFGSNVGESWVEADVFAGTAQCSYPLGTCYPSWVINSPNVIPSVLPYLHQVTNQTAITGGTASVDQSSLTGVTVAITGSTAADGTPVTVTSTVLNSQPGGTAQLSVEGVGFLDLKITGITDGTARVCITNPNVTPQATMQYWNGASWVSAGNIVVTGTTICGDIPVSALHGTPIALAVPSLTVSISCGISTAGKPTMCNVTSSNGVLPLIGVTFSAPGATPSSGSGDRFVVTFSTKGTYSISVTATDSSFATASTSTGLTVAPQPLTIAAKCGSAGYAGLGGKAECTAIANGGTTPYSFSWSAPQGTPTSGTGSSFLTSFAKLGTYNVDVTVTDINGVTASQTVPVIIAIPVSRTFYITTTPGPIGVSNPCRAPKGGLSSYPSVGGYTSSGFNCFTAKAVDMGWSGVVFDTSELTIAVVGGGPCPAFWRIADQTTDTGLSFGTGWTIVNGVCLGRGATILPVRPIGPDDVISFEFEYSPLSPPIIIDIAPTGFNIPYLSPVASSQSAQSATVTPSTVTLTSSAGTVSGLTAVSESSLPTAGKPAGVVFPYGFFSWTITGLLPGQKFYVSLVFPSSVPANSVYWKVNATNQWVNLCTTNFCSIVHNIVTMEFIANATGQVADPGGLAIPGASSPLTITAPAAVTLEVGDGCSSIGSIGTATASGGTPPITIASSPTGPFPLGATSVVWTATDLTGQTAQATQLVTVHDTIPPSLLGPAPITVKANVPTGWTGTLPPAIATDACPVTITSDAPAVFPVGVTTVIYTATDSSGLATKVSTTVTVIGPLAITASCQSNPTLGKPIVCDVRIFGGTAPYSASWSTMGGSPASGTGFQFITIFSTKGRQQVNATVSDSNGQSSQASVTFNVAAQPLVYAFQCGQATAGKPVVCDSRVTGGTAPYTVTWSATHGTQSTVAGFRFITVFPAKGAENVTTTITDGNGVTQSASTIVPVTAQPLVYTFQCGQATAGKPVVCESRVSGGSSPYTVTWSATHGTQSTVAGFRFITVFPAKGAENVTTTITDGNGVTQSASTIVQVTAQSLSLSISCGGATAGKPVTCNATAIGGSGPYSFSWETNGGTPATGTGASFTTVFSTKGTGMISATFTDANGGTSVGTDQLAVAAQPLQINQLCYNAFVGEPMRCTVSAVGGTGPYTFSWSALDAVPSSGTGSTFNPVFSVKGMRLVTTNVTDANGQTLGRSIFVQVDAQPLQLNWICFYNTVGKPVNCSASAIGGTPPFTFSWSAQGGTPPTATGSTFDPVFGAKGSPRVNLTVTDANRVNVTRAFFLTISAQPVQLTQLCFDSTAGKPMRCTVSAVGGTGPYSFTWSAKDASPSSGTGSAFNPTFAMKGTYLVGTNITDANGVTVTRSILVTVAPQALVAAFTFPSGPTSGKPFYFTANPSGGTGPYFFDWNFGDGTILLGSGSPEPHTYSVKGSYNVTLTLHDSNRATAYSSQTVIVGPQTLNIVPQCPNGIIGKPVTCTAQVYGGTSPYKITWSVVGGSPSTGTGSSFTTTFSTKGGFVVDVSVIDANNAAQSGQPFNEAGLAISAQPLVVTVACGLPSTSITAGKPFNCTVSATGGTSPYSGTGSLSVTQPVKGTFTETFSVVDANGVSASGSSSVTVAPQPLVMLGPSCNPNGPGGGVGTAGKPITCTNSASGGTPPYTFFWKATVAGQPAGNPSSGTGPSFTTIFSAKGTYVISTEVIDANGASSASPDPPGCGVCAVVVVVHPQPLIVTVNCPTVETAGKPFTCTFSATGGTPPYSTGFHGHGDVFTVTEPVKGTFTEAFDVTDANGVTASGSTTVTIDPQPLIVTVSCPTSGVTAGKPFNCSVSAAGGTAPYHGTGTFTLTQPVKGTFTESFQVTDSNGVPATGSASVTVSAQPTVVTVACPSSGVTAGKPFTCTATATGGTGPYTFTWSAPGATPPSGTGSSLTTTFPVKGTYTVTGSVKDANSATGSASVGVVASPQPFLTSMTFTPTAPFTGTPVTFTASASGGTAPYTFTWNFGDASSGSGSPVSHTYAAAGVYTVTLTTSDVNGATVITSSKVTVSVRFSLSKFFTRSQSPADLLLVDSKGNPKVDVVLANGVVKSTNPGQPRVWVNATNISGGNVNSITLNETLPVDWLIDPPWVPGSGAIHVYFVYTNKTLQEITGSAVIATSNGNPQTVMISLANIPLATGGTSLMPGEAIYLAVKLSYGLKGTVQHANTYPRFYGDTARLSAWTLTSYTGIQSAQTFSAFFVAYPKVLGDMNGDFKVDISDVGAVGLAFGSHPGDARWNPNADLNGDGVIDILDIAIAAFYYGTSS